jgi:hypothetical protein
MTLPTARAETAQAGMTLPAAQPNTDNHSAAYRPEST